MKTVSIDKYILVNIPYEILSDLAKTSYHAGFSLIEYMYSIIMNWNSLSSPAVCDFMGEKKIVIAIIVELIICLYIMYIFLHTSSLLSPHSILAQPVLPMYNGYV